MQNRRPLNIYNVKIINIPKQYTQTQYSVWFGEYIRIGSTLNRAVDHQQQTQPASQPVSQLEGMMGGKKWKSEKQNIINIATISDSIRVARDTTNPYWCWVRGQSPIPIYNWRPFRGVWAV